MTSEEFTPREIPTEQDKETMLPKLLARLSPDGIFAAILAEKANPRLLVANGEEG
jgi:hypothetical protein